MWISALLASALLQDAGGEAVTREAAGLRAEVDTVWPMPARGYPFPVRVRVENVGPPREIECRVENLYGGGQSNSWNVTRRFRLGSGEKVRCSVLVPSTGAYSQFQLRADGKEVGEFVKPMTPGRLLPQHLVVDEIRAYTPAQLEAAFPNQGGGTPSFVALPAQRLSDQWQAYAGLAAVWVREKEWNAMAPPVQEAILRAVKAGQHLVVYKAADPARFQGALGGWAGPPQRGPRGSAAVECGLGKITVAPGEIFGTALARELAPAPFDPLGTFFSQMGVFEGALDLKGVGKAPSGAFFWIILFFAILIGPVNLLFVRRLGKRVLFVITTPLLAFVAVGTLFAYSAVHEGFGLKGAVASFTLLNPEEKEAVSGSIVCAYSGMSTGTWRYRADSLCLNRGFQEDREEEYYYYRRRSRGTARAAFLDWSREQEISGGWVPSREKTYLSALQVVPHRGRLGVERAGGAPRVHNGLGTDILDGVVNVDGKLWRIPALPEGAAAPVQDGAGPYVSIPKKQLQPGDFCALVKGNPMLDTGRKNVQELSSFHLIQGRLSE